MPEVKIILGTVGSRNRALRALTNGGTARVSDAFLTPFSKLRPDDYLRCLETAAKMVRQGPTFCLDQKYDILMLASVDVNYKEGSGFRISVATAVLAREPNGKDWILTSLDVNEGPMPQNPPEDMWIKLRPASMASREDWESVCRLANAVPEDVASIKLHVSKIETEWEAK